MNLTELQGRFPDSPLAGALVYKTYPTGGDPGTAGPTPKRSPTSSAP
jgi:hypothetical protein